MPADVPTGLTEPRVWVQQVHGEDVRHYIRPAAFRCQQLAADLSDAWLTVAPELPGSVVEVRNAILSLLRFFDISLDRPASLSSLTRTQLDAWELHLLRQQLNERKERYYRAAVYMFALLRRIDDDEPGRLGADITARLQRETRLRHIRNGNVPPFEDDELLALIAVAGLMVKNALQLLRETPELFDGPDPALLAALHVLLSASTGEPPEVLRRMKISDLTPTVRQRRDGGPVAGVKLEALGVEYLKTRAGDGYAVGYTSRHPDALAAYGAVLELTAGLREESGLDGLWLTRDSEGAVVLCRWRGDAQLRHWAAKYAANLELSDPVWFKRIRKNVTTAEALENPTRYLRNGRRHTARTFLEHYANSPILRAEAGRVLVEAITTKFDAAVNGPTVVTREAEELIAAGQPAPGLDADVAKKAVAGELDTPTAACADIKASPHAPVGQVCPFSADGTCYTCGNALIMRHHLPGVLVTVDRIRPGAAARIEDWNASWRDLYVYLTEHVIPAFSEEDVTAARKVVGSVAMSPGFFNQPRGDS